MADIAYYIGEDTPCMVGITEPAPPSGLQYDFINAGATTKALKGNGDHTMSLPHGTSYRLLVLPPSGNMRPETLREIARIIRQGGVVLGPKPLRSPSLQGYPESDAEMKALADSLWGPGTDSKRLRRIGKGMLLTGYTIEEVLAELGKEATEPSPSAMPPWRSASLMTEKPTYAMHITPHSAVTSISLPTRPPTHRKSQPHSATPGAGSPNSGMPHKAHGECCRN